jgi:hypothetical protein
MESDKSRNKELIELNDIKNLLSIIFKEIMPLIKGYFEKHKEDEEELKKGVFYYFCEKAYQTLNAILLLIRKGYINDAHILLRSLFEVQITCRYIYFDIPNRLNKFLNFGWIESKQRLEKRALKVDEKQSEEIYKNYEKFKNEYKNKSRWESIKSMAEDNEVKQEAEYYSVYRYCSGLVHVNPLTQLKYFIQKTDYNETLRVYWASLWYSLGILETLSDLFKLGFDNRLNRIGQMIEGFGKIYF